MGDISLNDVKYHFKVIPATVLSTWGIKIVTCITKTFKPFTLYI